MHNRFRSESLESRRLLATISGTVFEDRNNNGTYESLGPDVGLTTTVYIDANKNAQFDDGEVSTTTSPMTSGSLWGRYSFTGLSAGSYQIRAVKPTNYAQTRPVQDAALVLSIGATTTLSGQNIGLRDTTQSSRFGGRVFNDADNSGTRSSDEAYLAGVTVYSDVDNDNVLDPNEQSTQTNASGLYVLDVLNPNYTATYNIRAVPPPGLTLTTLASTNGAFVKTIDAGIGTLPTDVFGFADLTPPTVAKAEFDLDAQPNAVRLTLSEPSVNTNWTVAFALTVTHDGVTLPPNAFTLQTNSNGMLTYALNPSVNAAGIAGGAFGDGTYVATLAANTLVDAKGNVQTTATTFSTTVLRGDLNGDRSVNFDDLLIVAKNYGLVGRTHQQGNVDGSSDGSVNFDDLLMLARKYGTTLPAALPAVAAVGTGASAITRCRSPL